MNDSGLKEFNIICRCLSDDNDRAEILMRLRPEHFVDLQMRGIFSCISELYKEKHTINYLAVAYRYADSIGEDKRLWGSNIQDWFNRGFDDYFPELIDHLIDAYNKNSLADLMLSESIKLRSTKGSVAEAIKAFSLKQNTCINGSMSSIVTPEESLKNHRDGKSYLECMQEARDQALTGKRFMTGIPFGFPLLDKATDGVSPGTIVVIGARTSAGKTQFALTCIVNWISSGIPVGLLSLEMPLHQINHRVICIKAKLNSKKAKDGTLSSDEFKRLTKAHNDYEPNKLFLMDSSSGLTTAQVRAKIWHMKQTIGVKIVVIDFITLMKSDKKTNNNHEKFGDIIVDLQSISKDLNVVIVEIAQLNRSSDRENRRPKLSDLSETGNFEQAADTIIFLHQPNFNNILSKDPVVELIVAKGRNDGDRVLINMRFDKEQNFYYEDANQHPAEEQIQEKDLQKGYINQRFHV